MKDSKKMSRHTKSSQTDPGNRETGKKNLPQFHHEELCALVEKASGGNQKAFEELVDVFHLPVFRMISMRMNNRMDAEDITQETFIRAQLHIHRLNEPGKFRSWLYQIAMNRIRDFYRKKRILQFVGASHELPDAREEEKVENTPEQEIFRKEFWKVFTAFTKTLSKMEKEVFLLRFVDQMGIREISEILRKSESAVKTHLYRAIAKCRNNSRMFGLLKEETP